MFKGHMWMGHSANGGWERNEGRRCAEFRLLRRGGDDLPVPSVIVHHGDRTRGKRGGERRAVAA